MGLRDRAVATELAAVGAATGGVAALPGVGTVASLATSAADVGWTTTRACDLVMAIGAVHGHVDAPPRKASARSSGGGRNRASARTVARADLLFRTVAGEGPDPRAADGAGAVASAG